MKKLVYKSYEVFPHRFYSFLPININSAPNPRSLKGVSGNHNVALIFCFMGRF